VRSKRHLIKLALTNILLYRYLNLNKKFRISEDLLKNLKRIMTLKRKSLSNYKKTLKNNNEKMRGYKE